MSYLKMLDTKIISNLENKLNSVKNITNAESLVSVHTHTHTHTHK